MSIYESNYFNIFTIIKGLTPAHEKAMVDAYKKASDKDKYTVDMVLNEYSDEDLPALAEKEKGETDIHSVG